ncbi:xanthine dehydrogenase accessory protein XdhC [Manganibacter manganicus]|uniref:Xanthine dehydrogenase accessory protein XdhC n=1 Tax=Manganibacter manganicus TaxID=1873176 RepID=A0A1V8RNY5_9HYPH|nr:xanthine dehydrogenase accessory protein XdhC [Pseudaminobacter manganicus]OQM74896.1 xanthine dehydrogenase accessory protein XdhC [Pseudaminobacter manganicus]
MTKFVEDLKDFLDQRLAIALVEVAGAKGSTPREAGARMLVSTAGTRGTIGGGQLEFMAIDKARQMLRQNETGKAALDIPLGPEIGQCCGGRVAVSVTLVDEGLKAELIAKAEAEAAGQPHLYIFGGGHVGHAMAVACALMPIHVVVVDTRADALAGLPESVETRLTPMPEEVVRAAPAGSAFAILTHDHALDFLIVAEALKRTDAAYVGMIGSKTKKATFKSWFLKTAGGSERQFARLVSPIGGETVKDKRPTVIAALAAAEIMTAFANHRAQAASTDAVRAG